MASKTAAPALPRRYPRLRDSFTTIGGRRLAGASLPKRAFYAAAAPLVPAIRLRRLARDVRRAGAIGATVRALPAIGLALGVGALGEAVGYAFGPGDAPRRIRPYESRRDLHVNERDRRAIARSARSVEERLYGAAGDENRPA